jgi:hypothetical protein
MGWYAIHWDLPAKGECMESDGGEFSDDTEAAEWGRKMLRRRAALGVRRGTLYETTNGSSRVVVQLSGRG